MPLLSDREGFDKLAGKRASCAVASKKEPMTVIEICQEADYPNPYTAEDWHNFVNFCNGWGIRCNIDNEPVWQNELQEKER